VKSASICLFMVMSVKEKQHLLNHRTVFLLKVNIHTKRHRAVLFYGEQQKFPQVGANPLFMRLAIPFTGTRFFQ